MHNFTFFNKTRIVFGRNTIASLMDLTQPYHKILMVYGGGSIKRNGIYARVQDALQGKTVLEFGGILPNPEYEFCMRTVEICIQENVDFILSVGGGSVLDAVKFVASAVRYKGEDPWDILEKGAPVSEALPIGCVLTLPATGSEMNMNAVISRQEKGQKLAFSSSEVLPVFSILDPETTFSLSPHQTGNGVVDAFVHVMEQYLTYPVNSPVQDRFAEGILLTLIEEGPKVMKTPDDYDVRANIMWCSTMALNHLIGSGVVQDWTTHMIGHELTARFGLDHARTLAVVLPAVMRHQMKQKREKLIQYGERVWNLAGNEDAIDSAILKTRAFFEQMGLPTTLGDYHISVPECYGIGRILVERNGKIGERRDIGQSEVDAILKLAASV
ncbi:iron-containing alcohol dehydrogenase [bacterium]|nr:iron-containing alcohol dehydrogenase [bacterium]